MSQPAQDSAQREANGDLAFQAFQWFAAGALCTILVNHKIALGLGVLSAVNLIAALWSWRRIPDWLGFVLALGLVPLAALWIGTTL